MNKVFVRLRFVRGWAASAAVILALAIPSARARSYDAPRPYSPEGWSRASAAGPELSTVAENSDLSVDAVVAPSPTPTPTPTGTPPMILTQPQSEAVNVGGTAAFWVLATTPPLTYQWSFGGVPMVGATSPLLLIANAHAANTGSYTVTVTNASGHVTSAGASLTLGTGSGMPPSFTLQPSSETMATGSTVVFNALAGGAGTISYQWFCNDVALAAATHPALVIGDTTAGNDGSFLCLAINASGAAVSQPAVLTVITTDNPGRPTNISSRAQVGTGANQLIIGFVVGGQIPPTPTDLLIRASGPALALFDVSGFLPDPQLQLNSASSVIAANDGWAGSAPIAATAAEVGAFPWTNPASHDSALLETLPSGPYSVVISGSSGDSGIALAEVYDATPTVPGQVAPQRLINMSSRALVGTGNGVLVAGFVVGGITSKTVLLRASGPALAPFGLAGVLADPLLQLNRSATVLATNSGWGGSAQIASIAASVGAFAWSSPSSHDAALLITLPPGDYTATVSGQSGDTGIALIEIYEVP
jgi:hypothetical protein